MRVSVNIVWSDSTCCCWSIGPVFRVAGATMDWFQGQLVAAEEGGMASSERSMSITLVRWGFSGS